MKRLSLHSYNLAFWRLPSRVINILKHRMFNDTAAIFIVYIALVVIGILTSAVIARSFSLHDMGRYQLILTYMALGQIMALPGMSTIITKGVLKNYDPIFYIALKRSIFSAGICSLLLTGFGIILYYTQVAKEFSFILIVVGLFLPLIGLEKYESFFQGRRKFLLSRKIAFFCGLGNLLIVGGTAYLTRSLFPVIVALFVIRAVSVVVILTIVKRRLSPQPRDPQFEQSLLKQGWQLSGLSIFNVTAGKIDRIILGMMDPKLLAFYHIGGIIPNKIKECVKSLIAVPAMHWSTLSKKENLKKIQKHIFKFFLLGSVLALAIWYIVPWFIPFLYGESYQESVTIARWLCIILPVLFPGTIILNVDIFQDKSHLFQKSRYITQSIYIIALAIIVPRWGLYGVVACFIARSYIMNGLFPLIYLVKNKHLLCLSDEKLRN